MIGYRDKLPFYVTRPSNGIVGEYSMEAWRALLIIWVVWLNIVVWGAVGLVVAVRVLL
jgi:hypothetical protein